MNNFYINLYENLCEYKRIVEKEVKEAEAEYNANTMSKDKFATLLYAQQELENVEELIESIAFRL